MRKRKRGTVAKATVLSFRERDEEGNEIKGIAEFISYARSVLAQGRDFVN